LVKDREVAAIDAVAAEDVCTDGVAGWRFNTPHCLECIKLMCGGVGTEHVIFVDVVGVCSASAGVICREAEDVEVGRGTDDGLGSMINLMQGWWED
jgi:hypothetical protein